MTGTAARPDVYAQVTNHILNAMETAGDFQLPWITDTGARCGRPVNIASKRAYQGVNVLSLWITSLAKEYPSHIWGTYRQWQAARCQVRRGEEASVIVFYRRLEREDEEQERFVAKASWVFNAAQVDGYEPPIADLPDAAGFDPLKQAEGFVAKTGAKVEERGDMACYIPSRDVILMPERRRFLRTRSASPSEAFYGTLCHELIHWSGSNTRLGRDLTGRFGDKAYAMEELVAELGAAFLCADLGISRKPREDHAAYIKSWLAVLKADKRAIFTAASKASQATQWLQSLGTTESQTANAA
ncbi:zincin-like metallopeptidase domain-containing protein [uncultured Marivita sp.]|uniref:ArdC family protein n=1 Tax=uncultured Marivita sp. TaxID=888080 RepID=UPI002637CC08|nr:zincin-like metallopeptidase domain-containing protein [uncultured Marivita sp.]